MPEQTKCKHCDGYGFNTCGACFGCGDIEVSDGVYETCVECNGEGSIDCDKCTPKLVIVDCEECYDGKIECPECEGQQGMYIEEDEWNVCSGCGGEGVIDCPECDGKGTVEE